MGTELDEIAVALQGRLSVLKQKETTLYADLIRIQQEKSEVETVIYRIQRISSGQHDLPTHGCRFCYVSDGRDARMEAISSDGGTDKYRCKTCGHEIEIEI